jgi:hypothetical protein
VLWIRWDAFGASEFSGGRITGKLFTMADLGSLRFLVALLLTIFFPQVTAAIALAATLCLPFYLYILMPGPYRQIFKGEYSVPLRRPFVWNNWAVVGVLNLVIAAFLSLHRLSKGPVSASYHPSALTVCTHTSWDRVRGSRRAHV